VIAMQYSFTLPADYDMAIIDRRIADKGHMLDHFDAASATYGASSGLLPGMRPGDGAIYYVWRDSAAMQRFLGSEGFANLAKAFGWPSIRVWPVWDAYLSPEARHARFASRDIRPIAPYAALDAEREASRESLQHDIERGALAAVSAFEPTTWTRVAFRLWDEARTAPHAGQWYAVGHVSQP